MLINELCYITNFEHEIVYGISIQTPNNLKTMFEKWSLIFLFIIYRCCRLIYNRLTGLYSLQVVIEKNFWTDFNLVIQYTAYDDMIY